MKADYEEGTDRHHLVPGTESRDQVTYEQFRLAHCIRLYEAENARREAFDKTAHHYLTLISVFLAGMLLKLDSLQTLSQLLGTNTLPLGLARTLQVSFGLMLLFLLLGLVAVLECLRVRHYRREYPNSPAVRLFAANSRYSGVGDSATFLRTSAMTYIAALESNFEITERKGQWIERASWFVLCAVLSLFAVIGIVGYGILR